MVGPALTGFATGLSLILAIGAQNAFVLRQGLLGVHVFWLCLLCATSDAILIAAGVAGFGAVTTLYPSLPRIIALAGAAFLFVYGAMRLRAAWQGDYFGLHRCGDGAQIGRREGHCAVRQRGD